MALLVIPNTSDFESTFRMSLEGQIHRFTFHRREREEFAGWYMDIQGAIVNLNSIKCVTSHDLLLSHAILLAGRLVLIDVTQQGGDAGRDNFGFESRFRLAYEEV